MSQDLSKDIQNGLLVYWNFDKIIDKNCVLDSVSNEKDQIIGYVDLLDGIKENALRLDGYTTHLKIQKKRLPESFNQFTISAWIANGAYTWNEGPIIENYNEKDGFFLGVTANGRIRFKVIINGEVFIAESEEKTPLFKWMNITSVFDSESGINLYINGELKSSIGFKENE